MQSAVETISNLELKINISVPADKLQSAYSQKVKEISKTAKIDGFRAGKVPAAYITKVYGPGIQSEVVDDLVRHSFNEVCHEKKIAVAGIEKVDVKQQELGKDLEFSISVEVYPEVNFEESDFSKMTVEKYSVKIGDTDVTEAIEKLRKAHATWEDAGKTVKAKMGDQVIIDFSAVQDGKDLDGGSAEDFDLELGSNHLIPGFEEGVVGHKVDDEFVLDLEFPKDYHVDEQAGKKASFTIKLKAIKHAKLPELDEAFCAKFGISLNKEESSASDESNEAEKPAEKVDVKELEKLLRVKVKESLESEAKHQVESKYKNEMFDALRSIKALETPKSLVESEITDLINQQQDRYRQYVGDKNAKLELDREKFRKQATKNIHLRLLVRGFIEQNNITADKETVKSKLSEVMGGHEISDDLLNWYYSDPKRLQQIESLALEEVVTQKLAEKAKITEKEISFKELMEAEHHHDHEHEHDENCNHDH